MTTIYYVRPIGSSEDVRAAAAAINRRLGDSGDSTSRREAEREISECHPMIRDCLAIDAEDVQRDADES